MLIPRHPAAFVLALAVLPPIAAADVYSVTFDAELRSEAATGRLILFFITETGAEWSVQQPINGPFFESPQPIASIAVENWQPGQPVVIDRDAVAFPKPLDRLDFPHPIRVQAILDLADNPERSHEDGPGNLYSDPIVIEVSAERERHFQIALTNKVKPRRVGGGAPETPHLRWIEYRSELLSDFYGRDVHHRAGVALPPEYPRNANADAARTEWPAIYMIPGYGGREESAIAYANLFAAAAQTGSMPMSMPHAVVIVLDAESPLGHHGFTDSPNHGPRSTALVREFIPHLESQFQLAGRVRGAEARIVTGHSSGGWTALWLQLNWPDTFGGCWASAPDPIDFEAFQLSNLYEDDNLYFLPDGAETPSHREFGPEGEDLVTMTVRQELLMEYAIHPQGGSGQQWDAWMAMFSPRDPETGFPARLHDPRTGAINREVVNHWRNYDITHLVTSDWPRFGPIVRERIRLAVGDKDSFYLERAVKRFRDKTAALQTLENAPAPGPAPGYIHIAPGADHSTITFILQLRWNEEMRAHLQAHGLHE